MGTREYQISSLRPADGIMVIRVSGEIDMTNSLAFREHLFGELDEEARRVVLDLHAADRVDTTGLSVILELARRCGREDREVAIVCPEGWVRRALANSGLDQVIDTHATLDEALGGPLP